MNTISKYKETITKLTLLQAELVKNYLCSNDQIKEICSEIENKINDFRPKIMLYGYYNAGKSTLLNALLGAELATIGKDRTTKEVGEYIYNGYTIYDTPGIGINNNDDKITFNQYKKCEIIIFVLNAALDIEDKIIYKKIKEVLEHKKSLIIAINNTRGFDTESMIKIKNKVIFNLAKIGVENCLNDISLIEIDAKSALKARLENKGILENNSNIAEIERAIKNILEKNNKAVIIRNLNRRIETFINNLINKVNDKNVDNEIKHINELLADIINRKNALIKETSAISNNKFAALEQEVFLHLKSNNYDAVNALINDTNAWLCNEVNQKFSLAIDDTRLYLDGYINALEKDNIIEEGKIPNLLIEGVKDITKQISPDMLKSGTQEATKILLTKAKDWIPKLMKGKGQVWINTASSTIASGCLAVFNILKTMYDNDCQTQRELEEIERKQEKIMLAQSRTKSICSKANLNFNTMIVENINNFYEPKIQDLNNVLDLEKNCKDDIGKIYAELINIIKALPVDF